VLREKQMDESDKVMSYQEGEDTSISNWDKIFQKMFFPMLKEHKFSNQLPCLESKQIYKDNVSSVMKSIFMKKLNKETHQFLGDLIKSKANLQKEKIEHWDQRFNEFFLPVFNAEKDFKDNVLVTKVDSQDSSKFLDSINKNTFVKKLNVEGFQPSDVNVVVTNDGKLLIEAKKEQREANGDYFSHSKKEIKQMIDLPKNINVDEITTNVVNGELVVRAPTLRLLHWSGLHKTNSKN
jgi:HSP20 family molecular chaperone IbpA